MGIELIGKSEHLIKSYPQHKHNSWEIIYNVIGNGKMLVDKETVPFAPGSIAVVPPNTMHYKYSDDFYTDIYLQIDFLPFKSFVSTVDDSDKNFLTLLEMAYRIFHKQEGSNSDVLDALSNTILRMLLNSENHSLKNPQIEEFKNILINHISDPGFKLSELLNSANYSKDHFRRLFKQNTGYTPHFYLQNLRINYAELLLKNKSSSNLNISDISYMCGYYDQRYFGRVFKKITGYTPSQYCQLKHI